MQEPVETTDQSGRVSLLVKRILVLGLPLLVLVGAFGGVAVMGLFSPEPEEKAETIEALSVLTAEAVSQPVRLNVVSQGEVRARTSVVLASEVGGRILSVSDALLPGGRFARGDRLVQIDPEAYELRVTQAEAAVAEAETALAQQISEAETAAQDVADLGIANVSDLALRRPQVAEAQARLASAQARLAEARLDRQRTSVRAPFDGRVQTRYIDQGALISAGAPIADVFASDVVEVAIPLTDSDLAQLGLGVGFFSSPEAPGPAVMLSARVADEPHQWKGRIYATASAYGRETRTLMAMAEVIDPYGAGSDDGVPLAVGLFVTAEIEGRAIDNGVVIPRTALRGDGSVYVAGADNTLEIRPVTVASSTRERAVLTTGLTAGERVITSPVRGASGGMAINPVDRSSVLANGAAPDGQAAGTAQ